MSLPDTSQPTRGKVPVLASIVIYLQKNSKPDDILYIYHLNNGTFRATFENRTINRDYITVIENCNNMIDYLDAFVTMTLVDRDGYDFIQVDIPGLPTAMIRPCRSDWDTIYYRLRSYLRNVTETQENWPKEYK